MNKNKQCPDCQGKGYISISKRKYIYIHGEHEINNNGKDIKQICYLCKGTGEVKNGN